MTFTKAANILAASVSSLPYYQSKSRVVSRVGTKNNGSIHREGNIFTGFYKNCHELSIEDRETVDAERVYKGTKKKPKDKKGGRQVSLVETKTSLAIQMKALKTAKRQISVLRRKVKQGSDSDDTSDSDPEDGAGNSFGGREEKDRKKKKKNYKKWLIGRSYLRMILTLIYYLVWSMHKQEWEIRICNFTTTERRDCSSRTISANSHTEPTSMGESS